MIERLKNIKSKAYAVTMENIFCHLSFSFRKGKTRIVRRVLSSLCDVKKVGNIIIINYSLYKSGKSIGENEFLKNFRTIGEESIVC